MGIGAVMHLEPLNDWALVSCSSTISEFIHFICNLLSVFSFINVFVHAYQFCFAVVKINNHTTLIIIVAHPVSKRQQNADVP